MELVTRTRHPLTVSVIGCGYLGAVHAAAMTAIGHTVIGVETDVERAAELASGRAPFYEPGLNELLRAGTAGGRLRFTTRIEDATDASLHFICVGTPQTVGQHSADLRYLDAAVSSLLEVIGPGDVVAGKSTVPVGTAPLLDARVRQAVPGAAVVWNPEFLREGLAVADTLQPDRIVIGRASDDLGARAASTLRSAYGDMAVSAPVLETDFATAELVKVAANAFLATKISFINAMAEMCEAAGGDVVSLADALGHDERIGRRFLNAGVGFGGGCLPKDIRAFMHRASELGAEEAVSFLREIDAINLRRRDKVVEIVQEWFDGDVMGRRVGVLGAAFKPDSDDIRDSPALAVAEALHLKGAEVRITDPRALASARRASPTLRYVPTAEDAAEDAEAVLLLTEWPEYVAIDPETLLKVVRTPRVLDGRNVLDHVAWRAAGWTYLGLGRPLLG